MGFGRVVSEKSRSYLIANINIIDLLSYVAQEFANFNLMRQAKI